MKIVGFEKRDIDEDLLKEVVGVLKKGGVVVYPSETCYGLMARGDSEEVAEKVYEIKKRPKEKRFLTLVRGVEDLENLVKWNSLSRRLAERFWPGPLTMVMEVGGGEGKAFRVTEDEFARRVMEEGGFNLISTSANISGEEVCYEVGEKLESLEVDLILDGGRIPQNKPTTIVDVRGESPVVLRLGEILEKDLAEDSEGSGGNAEDD